MKPFYKICCILGLLAVTIFANSCNNETAEADSERIKILGIDKDGNGVRDDLDSLIDAKIPDSPEKRAAYRYLAQAIQNQWTAFFENPQMNYEAMRLYAVFTALGIELIAESNAESYLPVAVKSDKQYANLVAKGMSTYNEILKLERMK